MKRPKHNPNSRAAREARRAADEATLARWRANAAVAADLREGSGPRRPPFRAVAFVDLPTTAVDAARGDLRVNLPDVRVWFEPATEMVRYEQRGAAGWRDCTLDELTQTQWDNVIVYVKLGGHYEWRDAVAEGGRQIRVF